MSKTEKLVVVAVLVIIVAGGAILVQNQRKDKDTSSTSKTSSSQSSSSTSDNTSAALTITYDDNGFSLSSETVKVGETVKVVNNSSSSDLQFDSDPHPVHTDNTELNIGEIAPGKSATFTVHKAGTWGFHNHLDSSQHGKFTVVE